MLVAGGAAIAGPASNSGASALPSSCGPLFYKGSGTPQFIIASDLPLQGAGRAQNLSMGQAIQYVLEKQYKFKAGKYTVGYQECDDSTAQTGALATRRSARRTHERTPPTSRSSACSGRSTPAAPSSMLPILNRAPGGSGRDDLARRTPRWG